MKRLRGPLIALALIGGALTLFWTTTMQAQRHECEVCVAFGPGRNCAKASGPDEAEASRTAHTTACGPLTGSMNDAIACQNRPPVIRRCTTR
ncbi:MAG: hypothetical protein MUF21_05450 [Gemmatimonadaceae bacterium]|nr:hypothetical protein [Gemmatimonadaceae bacterium]